jgi:hypothetical protein
MNEGVWSTDGMMLAGETEVFGEMFVSISLCSPQIMALRDRQIIA